MLDGVAVLIAGLLTSPYLMMAPTERNQEKLRKFSPFLGIMGMIILMWGVWSIFDCFQSLEMMRLWPVWWGTLLAMALGKLILGLLLSLHIIKKYIPSTKLCGQNFCWCGLFGIFLGIWYLGYYIVFHTTVIIH